MPILVSQGMLNNSVSSASSFDGLYASLQQNGYIYGSEKLSNVLKLLSPMATGSVVITLPFPRQRIADGAARWFRQHHPSVALQWEEVMNMEVSAMNGYLNM